MAETVPYEQMGRRNLTAEVFDYLYNAQWHIDRLIEQERDTAEFAEEWQLVEELPEADEAGALDMAPQYEHSLLVPSDIREQAYGIFDQITHDPAVRRIHALVEAKAPATRQHLLRSSLGAVTLALYRGRPEWQAALIGQAQLTDDAGKAHDAVLAATLSPEKIADNPALFRVIQRHPWIAVWLMHTAGADPNATILAGNHHDRQPQGRQTYAAFPDAKLLHDAHGREVDVDDLLEDMQLTDMLDALVRPLDQRGQEMFDPHRSYRADQPGSYEAAYRMIVGDKVPVSQAALEALWSVLPAARPRLGRAMGDTALRAVV